MMPIEYQEGEADLTELTNALLGLLQVSLSTLWSMICWPFRELAGTGELSRKVDELQVHVGAMTQILMIVAKEVGVADLLPRETNQEVNHDSN